MPIQIDLSGPQGNAFCVMGTVQSVLQQIGKSKDEIKVVMDDMQSGDYEHLKQVAVESTNGLIQLIGD
jgi:hypothetical protein